MGFFNFSCAASGISIASPFAEASHKVGSWPNLITLVNKDGSIMQGNYDGYGRIQVDDFDSEGHVKTCAFGNEIKYTTAKVVITRFYTGQTFDELGSCENGEYQGYFYPSNDYYVDIEKSLGDEPSAVRAILIIPEECAVCSVLVPADNSLPAIYAHLKCQTITTAKGFHDGSALYVDDEGLLHDTGHSFRLGDSQWFSGIGLIIKETDDETIACDMLIDDILDEVEWLHGANPTSTDVVITSW